MNYKNFFFVSLLICAMANDTKLHAMLSQRNQSVEDFRTRLAKENEEREARREKQLYESRILGAKNIIATRSFDLFLRSMFYNLYFEKSQARALGLMIDCYVSYLVKQVMLIRNREFFKAWPQTYAHLNLAASLLGNYAGALLAPLVKKYLPSSVDQHDANLNVAVNEVNN